MITPRSKLPEQLPRSDLYVIYSMSSSPYQRWQAELLDFSVREVGQRGVIVRLCSMEGDTTSAAVKAPAGVYTFVTPSHAELGGATLGRFVLLTKRLLKLGLHGRFHYYCLNKSHAMQAFLEAHPGLDDEAKLLWLDPDMVFHRSWEPPASMVRRGRVAGQYWWGYDQAWCRRSEGVEGNSLCPASDAAVMFPFCISVGDMRSIVGSYRRFSEELYQRTRDWKSEMYALVMAMSAAGLDCRTIAALGTCNNWPDAVREDPGAPISHYTQVMRDREGHEVWDKRKYTARTVSIPWGRPPRHDEVATLTDQRALQMLHRLIDRQHEERSEPPLEEASR